MRVVVAGGGGFIGSHLVDQLVARGDEVTVLDAFSTGRRSNLSGQLGSAYCEVIECDITKPLPEVGDVEAVVNLASPACPDDFESMPLEILGVGSVGNRRLLDLATTHGARFLLASTSEVYGASLRHPQSEDYWGNVDPIGPRSCYDEAKRFAEATTAAYARTHRLDIRIARIFNTYGERMAPTDGRVVAAFVARALRDEPLLVYGDGTQTRSFCHVSDQVAGLMALLDGNCGLPVNIGNPEEVTIMELAELVISIVRPSSEISVVPLPERRTGDPDRRCPDISRAWSELGWEPLIALSDGVAAMASYFRDYEELG